MLTSPTLPKAPIEEEAARLPKEPVEVTHLTSGDVWRSIAGASFAVVAHVTARGEPRSSGVVYGVAKRKLYVAVAPDSWKARQLVSGQRVHVTVLVRRGGILGLVFPIPPATISFQAKVRVYPSGSVDLEQISPKLKRLLPAERKSRACILELAPEGSFLTFGVGVSLSDMRKPELSRAHVPVA